MRIVKKNVYSPYRKRLSALSRKLPLSLHLANGKNDTMKPYDVLVLGGGLAGLSLALQLKRQRPCTSVMVLEKRSEPAPLAVHKVGESTSELSAHYFRNVLQLSDLLHTRQLRKYGFRFFFSPEHRDDITRRVEVGSRLNDPIPTHQIDRGLFENDLQNLAIESGVEVRTGAVLQAVELSPDGHSVVYADAGGEIRVTGRWVVDATGRRSFLKRRLGLGKPSGHAVNAAWFRLDHPVDPDLWSDDPAWRSYLAPGRRRLATNHLMGAGYWVWLIPLVSGATSVGIVADPEYHPFETFNTLPRAMDWLRKYEPQAAAEFSRYEVLDFKVMKHFAHDTGAFYHTDRWALTGDAGAFLDPFYSPGSDFIALSNSWITDLVVRDLNGENIALRTLIYEHAHRELYRGWLQLYQNQYGGFGNTRLMLMKIVWDWGTYWSFPAFIFSNGGYTDLTFLKRYSATNESVGRRFARLNDAVQDLFRAWARYPAIPCSDLRINVFELDCLHRFHLALKNGVAPDNLFEVVEANLRVLEDLAAELFRRVSTLVNGTPYDLRVDPYTMNLDDSPEVLMEKAQRPSALGLNDNLRRDLDVVWPAFQPKETYA